MHRYVASHPVLGTLLALVACGSTLGCSSDEPAPPPSGGPIFTDAFDDATPLPRGWDAARGAVTVAMDPSAPSGGRSLSVQSIAPKRGEATLRRSLTAPGAKSVTCTLWVNAPQSIPSPQTVMRIDVLGGAVFVDVLDSGFRLYGTFGVQQFNESSTRPSKARWVAIAVSVANTGSIVGTFDGEVVVRNLDVKASPTDVAKGAIEIGVFAPPAGTDVAVSFDDVQCTAK